MNRPVRCEVVLTLYLIGGRVIYDASRLVVSPMTVDIPSEVLFAQSISVEFLTVNDRVELLLLSSQANVRFRD